MRLRACVPAGKSFVSVGPSVWMRAVCALLHRRGCNWRRCNVSEQPEMLLRLGARAHVNTAGKSFVSVGPSVWMRAVAAAMGKQLGVDRGGLDVLIDNARAAVSAVHGRL